VCKKGHVAVDGTCVETNPCRWCSSYFSRYKCPCPDYMKCKSSSVGEFTCQCRGSWGDNCENSEENACLNAQCNRNAVCKVINREARCLCKSGYHGDGKICLPQHESCSGRCEEEFESAVKLRQKSANAFMSRYYWQSSFVKPKQARSYYELARCRCGADCVATNSCCQDYAFQCKN